MSMRKVDYPIGSISSGTMRPEDLIPTFASELTYLAKRPGILPLKRRKEQLEWLQVVNEDRNRKATVNPLPFQAKGTHVYNSHILFDMLGEYAGPYFYFGAHPGDGSDYGYWLNPNWDHEFSRTDYDNYSHIIVSDLSEVPVSYRGEVMLVNDHGNLSLYVKSARKLREIWSVV